MVKKKKHADAEDSCRQLNIFVLGFFHIFKEGKLGPSCQLALADFPAQTPHFHQIHLHMYASIVLCSYGT